MSRLAVMVAFCVLVSAPGASGQRTMLAHLPSAPVEAANRQAAAITTLAELLSQRLAGEVEVEIFRHWRDAHQLLNEKGESVAMVLCDASFAAHLPADLVPAYRFVRGGIETYRRLLVVQAGRKELAKLVDLEGAILSVVETAGSADSDFLAREVFEGELDPGDWFSAIEPAVDDFSATANVLYGQTDAALVAEYNPLLTENLDRELRVVFESPPLSLPVLALRASAFTAEELETVRAVLTNLAADPRGRQVASALGIDALRALPRGGSLGAAEPRRVKQLEIAAPTGDEWTPQTPPLPSPAALSFAVTVELPEIPLPTGDEPGH